MQMRVGQNWREMPNGDEKRHAYLCSREWAVKKAEVRKRSGGRCERCKADTADHCHHLTYLRLYDELPTDLMDVCQACHQFVHGRSKHDPVEYWKEKSRPSYTVLAGNADMLCVQCPHCRGEMDNVHIQNVEEWKDRGEISFVEITFRCECGKPDFKWQLRFHKGTTFFGVDQKPSSQD